MPRKGQPGVGAESPALWTATICMLFPFFSFSSLLFLFLFFRFLQKAWLCQLTHCHVIQTPLSEYGAQVRACKMKTMEPPHQRWRRLLSDQLLGKSERYKCSWQPAVQLDHSVNWGHGRKSCITQSGSSQWTNPQNHTIKGGNKAWASSPSLSAQEVC